VSTITYNSKDEWLTARKSILTATQAAHIWTAHVGGKVWPGSTPYDVWAEKAGEAEPFEENHHTWMGKALEYPMCVWVAEQFGRQLDYPEPWTIVTRGDEPWMGCTPDAYLICTSDDNLSVDTKFWRELVEVKTASWVDEWGDTGSVAVPGTYLAQCTWQMAVTGLDVCHLGVFLNYAVDGYSRPKMVKDRRHYTLRRILVMEQMMIDVCKRFWNRYIVGGFPPPKKYPVGGES
jgi:putative phage-type endonuclease